MAMSNSIVGFNNTQTSYQGLTQQYPSHEVKKATVDGVRDLFTPPPPVESESEDSDCETKEIEQNDQSKSVLESVFRNAAVGNAAISMQSDYNRNVITDDTMNYIMYGINRKGQQLYYEDGRIKGHKKKFELIGFNNSQEVKKMLIEAFNYVKDSGHEFICNYQKEEPSIMIFIPIPHNPELKNFNGLPATHALIRLVVDNDSKCIINAYVQTTIMRDPQSRPRVCTNIKEQDKYYIYKPEHQRRK